MTEKLFWREPYQTEFTATVIDQFPVQDGHAVVLNQTCFYATSGGQPNDTGVLNGSMVRDVRFQDDRLIHVLTTPLEVDQVVGRIDWERRFDHMQQHTGQHILSAAFYRLFQAETSSFHLGEEYCSIELSKPSLNQKQIRQAEEESNSVVFGAQPIETFFVDPEKAGDFPLRKKSDLQESLRIVKIGDFDLSPCSGTHVRNAGEVGGVFITGAEKLSQTLKVSFLCGKRILNHYHRDQEILKELCRKMTTSPELLPESVAKLQDQLKQLRKELSQFREEQWKQEAGELYSGAAETNGIKPIVGLWNRPYTEIRFIAQRLAEQPLSAGVLVSVADKRAVFFKNPQLALDIRSLFQKFLQINSAKGGGPPHFLEAGGFEIRKEMESDLRRIFTEDSEGRKE